MSLLVFATTSPADRDTRIRIENARKGVSELCREARQRKLDPSGLEYALATERMADQRWPGTWGINDFADRMLKAARLYTRIELLKLLDEMDAWEVEQARKAAEKKVKA